MCGLPPAAARGVRWQETKGRETCTTARWLSPIAADHASASQDVGSRSVYSSDFGGLAADGEPSPKPLESRRELGVRGRPGVSARRRPPHRGESKPRRSVLALLVCRRSVNPPSGCCAVGSMRSTTPYRPRGVFLEDSSVRVASRIKSAAQRSLTPFSSKALTLTSVTAIHSLRVRPPPLRVTYPATNRCSWSAPSSESCTSTGGGTIILLRTLHLQWGQAQVSKLGADLGGGVNNFAADCVGACGPTRRASSTSSLAHIPEERSQFV